MHHPDRRKPAGMSHIAVVLAAAMPLAATASEHRTFDGTLNNKANPQWGAAQTPLLRAAPAAYADGISIPSGTNRPNARVISNTCGAQPENRLSARMLSDLHTLWGQFIDHDLDHTTDPGPDAFGIPVPAGDLWFDPGALGDRVIPMRRSLFDPSTGPATSTPQEQVNTITAWIDASLVYGSDRARASALRAFDGFGRLRTSEGDEMPFNTIGIANANPMNRPPETLFLSGDIRTNENCQLIALHAVFVREHNRLCVEIAAAHPDWDDEQIYQRARTFVGGFMQAITFEAYLPALLGDAWIEPYAGYDPRVNPTIANEFSAAAFRFGHSQVNEIMLRLGDDGLVVPAGHINMRDTFFAPDRYMEAEAGAWLKGAAMMISQEIDLQLVSSLRNFLFGPPGSTSGIDLFAINTQRGREHGLPDLNTVRVAYGLAPHRDFTSISGDPQVRNDLAAVYRSVDEIDLWVGGLAEDHVAGASVGSTFHAIISDQFRRLRDGDRFWYEHDPSLSETDRALIRATTLSQIIVRNTELTHLPENVFFAPNGYQPMLADLSLDGRVDSNDLMILLNSWGDIAVHTSEPRADLNGDGRVDEHDLRILLSNWQPG